MDQARWERTWKLFHEALERPEEERLEFLRDACADAELHAEVESLLASHEADADVLDRGLGTAGISGIVAEEPDLVGERIGPYRIVERLGEGGMGTVYEAEQEEPVRRRVALKVIRPGMETREVLARFETERQALALMNHPGIATVYRGGATEEGRPYFVMELVDGEPITRYCDRERLGTRERLELFLQVCDAVQHAHRKGVLHRDLKPSNVLVVEDDGRPVPKVIDFGVAKALERPLSDRTFETRVGRMIGTPEYMSPEQAATAPDVDTRTDVYCLGVLLFELLVGVRPFDFRQMSLHRIYATIRETDPPPPSRMLGAPDLDVDTAVLADRRSTDPEGLEAELRGELDWVVMKALEKDRDRRYRSVAELADDLARVLTDEPVSAGPPSATYRLRKFVRRNRAAAISGVLVFMTLVAATATSTWFGLRAREQQRFAERALAEAEEARREAEAEAEESRAVNDFLFGLFAAPDPGGNRASGAEGAPTGRDARVADVLDHAAATVGDRLDEQPRTEAAVRATIGLTYKNLGMEAEAEDQLRQALAIRERLLDGDHPETLDARHNLAAILDDRGEYDEAIELLETTVEGRERTLGPDDEHTLTSKNNLAILLYRQGRFEETAVEFREILASFRRTLGDDHFRTLAVANNLATVRSRLGDLEGAESLYREVYEKNLAIEGPEHPNTLRSAANLGGLLLKLDEHAEAEGFLRDATTVARRTLGPQHPLTLDWTADLGAALRAEGRQEEAAALFREVLDGYQETRGADHPSALTVRMRLARTLVARDRLTEAEEIYADLLPTAEEVLPVGNFDLARIRGDYGALFIRLERYPRAEALLVEAFARLRSTAGPENDQTRRAARRLVELYDAWGKPDRAREYRDLVDDAPAT